MEIPIQLLHRPFSCTCGKTHFVPIETVVINDHAMEDLLVYLREHEQTNVLLVADSHTFQACGEALYEKIVSVGVECHLTLFENAQELHPDEEAIAKVRSGIETYKPQVLIAVGSGTLNDITRYASYEAQIPYIVFATAPSMDGYASSVAAMQFAGVKTTFPSQAPLAIFADETVLAAAPWALIQAGFGDLLGKVTSLLDWKLSTFLYEESFCVQSYEMVSEPLRYCLEHAQDLRDRNVESVRQLFLGLIHAGIAMAMVGNSRPCSGSEHHCSHYWDLLAYKGIRAYASHGLQVGYAVHWTSRFYEYLRGMEQIRPPLPLNLSREWEEHAITFYQEGAPEILSAQRDKRRWLEERSTVGHFDDIAALQRSLEPELSLLEPAQQALKTMEIPDEPHFIELDPHILRETFTYASDLRARYTIFDFLRGQGTLQDAIKMKGL